MKKKILHVISGLGDGGAEAILYRLCKHEIQNTHIVVSLGTTGKYHKPLQEVGVVVHVLGMKSHRLDVAAIFRLFFLIFSVRPYAVQTWMYHSDLLGGICARIAGVNRVYWGIHNTLLEDSIAKRSTQLVAKLCGPLSFLIPRRIACVAKAAMHAHHEMGYCRGRMIHIPNGYDTEYFFPETEKDMLFRKAIGVDQNAIVLGTVGRFDPMKDYRVLIKAMGLLKQRQEKMVNLLMIGTALDPSNQLLNTWLRENDLLENTILLGRRNDIPRLMNQIDIFVLSSNTEAFPNVVAEAMACSTPVVSTEVGDVAQIVGQTGWLVPRGSPFDLSIALDSAISSFSASTWLERKKQCRSRIVENFSIDRMCNAYRDLWSSK